MYQDIYFFFR